MDSSPKISIENHSHSRLTARSTPLGAVLLGLVLMTGCAAPLPAPAPAPPDPVQIQIDQSLSKKAQEKVTGPEVAVAKPVYTVANTTVSYFGDVGNLLSDVAKAMGWEYKATGPQPRLPIFVQIEVKQVRLTDFLTQVARQLSERADIVIEGNSIELRYRAN